MLLCVLNICIGSVSITVFDILASIQGKTVENARILWDIRMPRMLAALILGGALGLAGYLLQTFFHNPIAGPVCSWYFLWCKDDRIGCHGIFDGTGH